MGYFKRLDYELNEEPPEEPEYRYYPARIEITQDDLADAISRAGKQANWIDGDLWLDAVWRNLAKEENAQQHSTDSYLSGSKPEEIGRADWHKPTTD